MIEKAPATVGAVATGATAGVVVTTEAATPAIPLLQFPIAYFDIGGQLVVLPVQNIVVLATAFFSCLAVIISITNVIKRRKV
jgi:hypothetical protein|tara:strand:+ start:135 stop:380 length:246 start_codon:yes stop_codon:yes gene_type:complete